MKIIVIGSIVNYRKDKPERPFNKKKFEAQQKQLTDKFIKDQREQKRLRGELVEQKITYFMRWYL